MVHMSSERPFLAPGTFPEPLSHLMRMDVPPLATLNGLRSQKASAIEECYVLCRNDCTFRSPGANQSWVS